ncbi:MAG: MFS transporter [Myxococcota bacterium]|nr:MFS transporter [Myxococcota bacterium]
MPRLLTAPFALLIVAHFLASLGFASMLLLPLYLDWLGAGRAEIGAIMASAAVGGLISRPLVGIALDALGRRATLIVGHLFAVLGLSLVWFIVDMDATTWVMRILFGVGEGAMFAGYFTFAADLIPEERRTEGIAVFGISGLLPLMVSPLATVIGVNPPDLRWFIPAIGVLVGLSTLCLLPIPEPPSAERPRLSWADALAALRDRPLWPVWLATIIFSGMVGLFMAFTTVVAQRRGVSFPTGMWLTYAGGAATVRLIGARLPDRVGPTNMVAPSLASYVLALFVATSASTSAGFLLAGLLAGLGHGYCFPVLTSQVIGRTPDAYRGSAMSLFTALWGLSALVLNPLGGALADAWGDGAMFTTAAGMAIFTMLLWTAMEHRLGVPAR